MPWSYRLISILGLALFLIFSIYTFHAQLQRTQVSVKRANGGGHTAEHTQQNIHSRTHTAVVVSDTQRHQPFLTSSTDQVLVSSVSNPEQRPDQAPVLAETINEYLHFSNVALDATSIHVYAPSAHEAQALRSMGSLPPYKRFDGSNQFFDLPTPTVVVHEKPLSVATDCPDGLRHEHAFFSSPWHMDNMFHLHNDNLIPLVDNIRHVPGCNATTLDCNLPTTLYQFKGGHRTLKAISAASVLRQLFDNVKSWQEAFREDNQKVCFASMSWGRGPYLFYVSNQAWYTNGPQSDVAPLRYWTNGEPQSFNAYAKTRAIQAVHALKFRVHRHFSIPSFQAPAQGLKAVYIRRSGQRNIVNTTDLLAACRKHGWRCEECCNWETDSVGDIIRQLADASVVMGPHGSGLAHVLYARAGAALIDFGSTEGWAGPFANMARSNGNGVYEHVPEDKWPMTVSYSLAEATFKRVSQALS